MKVASQSEVVINISGKDGGAVRLLDHLESSSNRASRSVDRLNKKASTSSIAFRKMASATSIAQGQLGAVSGRLSALSSTFASFGTATTMGITALIAFGTAVAKSLPLAMHYEKSMRILQYATGDAAASFEYAMGIAEKYNISIQSTILEYGKLQAAMKGSSLAGEEAKKLFEAVAVASTALGMSADETSGTFKAFIQMISKGCHAKGTMISMYDGGFKAIEDIIVGDVVLGGKDDPKEVVALVRGRDTMVRIIPCDETEPFIVNIHHKYVTSNNRIAVLKNEIDEGNNIIFIKDDCELPCEYEILGEDDYYGITLDGDRIYKCKSLILHHNSVMAEELRGQLGERLVNSFGMAAKALGMTTVELNKALEQGLVKASDLIPKISRLMLDEFSGTASEAATSLQGRINELGNAWYGLGVSMQKAGLTDVAASILGAAAEFVKGFSDDLENVSLMMGKNRDKRKQLLFDLQQTKEKIAELKKEAASGKLEGVDNLWGLPSAIGRLVKGEKWMKDTIQRDHEGLISNLEMEVKRLEAMLAKLDKAKKDAKPIQEDTPVKKGSGTAKVDPLDARLDRYRQFFDKMAQLDDEAAATKEQKAEIRYIKEWNKLDAKLKSLEALKVGKTKEQQAKIQSVIALYQSTLESMEQNHNVKMEAMFNDLKDKELSRHEEKMAKVAEFTMSPLQIEQEAYQQRLQAIDDYYAQRKQRLIDAGMSEKEINKMIEEEKLAETIKYNKAKEKIEKEAHYNNLSLASGFFGSLGALLQTKGKAAFEMGKKMQIASTIVSTYSAAQKAYDSQIIPGDPTSPVRGAIAAATAVMQGMARVNAIKNTQYNSTSAPSSGGGGSAPSAAPSAPQPVAVSGGVRLDINLNSQGGNVSQADLALLGEQLAPYISDAISRGLGGVPVLP